MNDILDLQKKFSAHLHNKNDKKIIKLISCKSPEALARLNIYRNNVFGSFKSMLSSIFSVTKIILKEKEFEIFVEKYCKKFDSKSGNLDEYGEFFPKLLKNHKIKYLQELANLELVYYRSYFAADVKKEFDIEKFKKISTKKFVDLTFELHPSCVLISSKFPLFSIWSQKIIKAAKPQFIMVERVFNDSNLVNLSQEEFLFLSLIQKKYKLYKIYKEIYKKTGKEIDIGALINQFISGRIIVDFKL